jgi:hypothetical protein
VGLNCKNFVGQLNFKVQLYTWFLSSILLTSHGPGAAGPPAAGAAPTPVIHTTTTMVGGGDPTEGGSSGSVAGNEFSEFAKDKDVLDLLRGLGLYPLRERATQAQKNSLLRKIRERAECFYGEEDMY